MRRAQAAGYLELQYVVKLLPITFPAIQNQIILCSYGELVASLFKKKHQNKNFDKSCFPAPPPILREPMIDVIDG